MLLMLEKRVKFRFDEEELRLLGAVSGARALTLSSLDGRIGKLVKKDPPSDSRMKEAPEDLAALIAAASSVPESKGASSSASGKGSKKRKVGEQEREKRAAAGRLTAIAAKEATAMRPSPATQNTSQAAQAPTSRISEGGAENTTPSSPSSSSPAPPSSLSLPLQSQPDTQVPPQRGWLPNIFRA